MPTTESINNLKNKENIICQMYNDGYSSNKISNLLHISTSSVKKVLNKYDVQIRDASTSHKIYNCNESTFEICDSHEKAYWIGFLQADAAIINKRLVLALSIKDKNHLEKFRSFMNSDHKILQYEQLMGETSVVKNKDKKYFYVYLGISSKKIIENLSKFSIIPNKSFTTKFGINIPNEFIGSYMAGLLDADGFVTVSNNKITIGFLGNENMTNNFQKTLLDNIKKLPNNQIINHPNSRNKSIRFSGKKVLDIGKFLYGKTPVYLERKRNKILSFFQQNSF